MTADAFTTAARAEAERRNPPIDRYPDDFTYPRAVLREHKRGEFEAAAGWARDHLAAKEPTDAEVEALVDSLNWAIRGTTDGDLIDQDSDIPAGEVLRLIREGARAALTAAKEARA